LVIAALAERRAAGAHPMPYVAMGVFFQSSPPSEPLAHDAAAHIGGWARSLAGIERGSSAGPSRLRLQVRHVRIRVLAPTRRRGGASLDGSSGGQDLEVSRPRCSTE
jgi:hypothetical protein